MLSKLQEDEVKSLRKKLAACEAELSKERARTQRLQAETLYMQTAISKYVPPTSYLHPSATACSSNTHATYVAAPFSTQADCSSSFSAFREL